MILLVLTMMGHHELFVNCVRIRLSQLFGSDISTYAHSSNGVRICQRQLNLRQPGRAAPPAPFRPATSGLTTEGAGAPGSWTARDSWAWPLKMSSTMLQNFSGANVERCVWRKIFAQCELEWKHKSYTPFSRFLLPCFHDDKATWGKDLFHVSVFTPSQREPRAGAWRHEVKPRL